MTHPMAGATVWPREPAVLLTHRLPPRERLRAALPRTFDDLLDAASCVQAISAFQRLDGSVPAPAGDAIRSLGRSLSSVAAEVAETYDRKIGQDLAEHAARLERWRHRNSLPRHAPALHHTAPWILCGPLHTWRARSDEPLMSLIVALPDAEPSRSLSDVDAGVRGLTEYYEQVLHTGPMTLSHAPAYLVADLLLEVGGIAAGHHHFAHFLPTATGLASGSHNDYTLVLSNILEARFRLISVPLFERLSGPPIDYRSAGHLDWLHSWFRGHDLGHFWTNAQSAPGAAMNGNRFVAVALDEAKADVLGACAATGPWGDAAGIDCYVAEILRYARRDPFRFADSMAATVELQMLADSGAIGWQPDGRLEISAAAVVDALPDLAARLIDPGSAASERLRDSVVATTTEWSTRLGAVTAVDDLLYEWGV